MLFSFLSVDGRKAGDAAPVDGAADAEAAANEIAVALVETAALTALLIVAAATASMMF